MQILVGDDHPLFCAGLHRLLEQWSSGAEFIDTTTFDAVLEICGGPAPLDLILIDLQMPGWPGFTGIGEVRARRPGVPVVVVSASESRQDMRAALEHGAAGFIPKSSSVKVMLSALDLVFAGGRYVPALALQGDGDGLRFDPARGEAGRPDEARAALVMNGAGGGAARGVADLLTQRQWDVMNGLRAGKSNKQIAYELGLSEGTVKIHVTAIFKSLGVRNRTQAVISLPKLTSVGNR